MLTYLLLQAIHIFCNKLCRSLVHTNLLFFTISKIDCNPSIRQRLVFFKDIWKSNYSYFFLNKFLNCFGGNSGRFQTHAPTHSNTHTHTHTHTLTLTHSLTHSLKFTRTHISKSRLLSFDSKLGGVLACQLTLELLGYSLCTATLQWGYNLRFLV